MAAIGIVRRIDALGRIVLPKELRRTLRLRAGTAMEIFTESDGALRLRKYAPIRENSTARELAESIADVCGAVVLVTDMDNVLAAAGDADLDGAGISAELERAINERRPVLAKEKSQVVRVTSDVGVVRDYEQEIIVPIMPEGDTEGAVVILSKGAELGEAEMKLAKMAAEFIGKRLAI